MRPGEGRGGQRRRLVFARAISLEASRLGRRISLAHPYAGDIRFARMFTSWKACDCISETLLVYHEQSDPYVWTGYAPRLSGKPFEA